MLREPAIADAKNSRNTGELRRGMEGPSPPDLPRQIHDGFSAAIDFALSCDDAHLAKQLIGRQGEKGRDARIL